MRNYVLFLIGLWCLSGETRADCASDVMRFDSGVMRCVQNLAQTMQAQTMQSHDQFNPTSMCTGEIKENMLCLIDFVQRCPEHISDGRSMLSSLTPVIDQFNAVCKDTTPAPESCPEFIACSQNIQQPDMSMMMPSGRSTPFSLAPVIVYSLCSVFKHQLDCMDAHRAACPAIVNSTEAMLLKTVTDASVLERYGVENTKMLVSEMCPKIPADFASNACVRERLESSGFIKCMSLAKRLSDQASEAEQCKYYSVGKSCIADHIGRPCGQENAKVLVETAHLVIKNLPRNCEMPEQDNDTLFDTLQPPYKKPQGSQGCHVKRHCCEEGQLKVNFGSKKYKVKKNKEGSLKGVTVGKVNRGSKKPCSQSVVITADFERLDNNSCFGCLQAPYCGRRMLKIDLELSNAGRGGWLFNVGDSQSGALGNEVINQEDDAKVAGMYPNITVHSSSKCAGLDRIAHIIDGSAPGVQTVTIYVSNEHIRITNSDGLDYHVCNNCLFALNGQSDDERVFIALNTVLSGLPRVGNGVCSATLTWACPWCE